MAKGVKSRSFSFENLSILIVDDQAFLRSLVGNVLKGFGCNNIAEAGDGKKAIEMIEKNPKLDVILCDIEMEPMNGLKLVRAIRAGLTKATYDVPIIMLTMHSEQEMVREALALHINGFLVKPVRPATIREKIEMAINNPLTIDPLIPEEGEAETSSSATAEEEAEASSSTTAEDETRVNAWVLRNPADVAKIKDDLQKRLVSRKASQLIPGSTIAEDVKSPEGGTVIRSGTTLTSEVIELIQKNEYIMEVRVLE